MDPCLRATASEMESLLLEMIPVFVAQTQITPSPAASLNEENFRVLLEFELSELKENLECNDNNLDKSSEAYREMLEDLLWLLEGFIASGFLTPDHVRLRRGMLERLPSLQFRLRHGDTQCLHEIVFSEQDIEYKEAKRILEVVNRRLGGKDDDDIFTPPDKPLFKTKPVYEIRDSAILLFDVLVEHMKKIPLCQGPTHEVTLCLSRPQRSHDPPGFDLMISDHRSRWQEARVDIRLDYMDHGPESNGPRLHFEEKRPIPCDIMNNMCATVSRAVKNAAQMSMWVLKDHSLRYTLLPPEISTFTGKHDHNFWSLGDLIRKLQEERLEGGRDSSRTKFRRKQKRVVAVLLAHCLLQFCGSSWLQREWNKDSVDFCRHTRGCKLVLRTKLCDHQNSSDPDAELRAHPFPGLLGLGIILLELELETALESISEKWKGEENPNTQYAAAIEMSLEIEEESNPEFRAAIRACLQPRMAINNEERINSPEKIYSDTKFKRMIYNDIIVPLEYELAKSFPDMELDNSEYLPLQLTRWDEDPQPKKTFNTPVMITKPAWNSSSNTSLVPSREKSLPAAQAGQQGLLSVTPSNGTSFKKHSWGLKSLVSKYSVKLFQVDSERKSQDSSRPSSISGNSSKVEIQEIQGPDHDDTRFQGSQSTDSHLPVPLAQEPIYLYGDSDKSSTTPQELKSTNHWLGQMSTAKTSIRQKCSEKATGYAPVKIAILDTGFEVGKGRRAGYKDRLVYKSWVEPRSLQNETDLKGHGTHATTLLLDILLDNAPDAIVHTARVFSGAVPQVEEFDNIADAIEHAVKNWKVDIITMSFGINDLDESPAVRQGKEKVRQAIISACKENVILFAAASNDGRNGPGDGIAWPACMPDVICIHSGTGRGKPSEFTPEAGRENGFMTLGELVESAWPPHLKATGDKMRKSGTSTATPIAAAIAALVLQYARCIGEVEEDMLEKLKSPAGMRAVLALMSKEDKHGYRWLKPWEFFGPRETNSDIKKKMERALEKV